MNLGSLNYYCSHWLTVDQGLALHANVPLGGAAYSMPTVAQISGGIRICQYYGDHNPPHFHAIDGGDEVLLEIALGFNVVRGKLKPGAHNDVLDWATPRRAALALNWVDALAQAPINRIA